ncbi:MAG: hypothetical protein N2Z74_00605 [Syntrophales bacterium]|nr:hypothetical protein [Syntrophales bacterium]
MYLNPDPYIMAAIRVCRDLEFHSLEADAVVGADRPLILLAEDIIEIPSLPRDKRCSVPYGRHHELGVEPGEILLRQIAVGGIHVRDPMISQLFDKPILMRLKSPLAALAMNSPPR